MITILEDPFVPPIETIVGVYCIYRKSILNLLKVGLPPSNRMTFRMHCERQTPDSRKRRRSA